MTKGQTEIMGLAIIVVLISMGIIFTLVFVFGGEEDTTKDIYQRSQLSSNLLNSMTSTSTACKGATMKELIQDCVTKRRLKCDNKNSCSYMEDAVEIIFVNTLDKWKYSYIFTMKHGDRQLIKRTSGQCDEYESSFHYIPTSAGNVELKLSICK